MTYIICSQKYQNLKRDSEALHRGPAASATNPAAAKSKTTVDSTTANKKRKATSAATDDEEDFVSPAKVRKLKAEKVEEEDKSCIKVEDEAEAFGDEMYVLSPILAIEPHTRTNTESYPSVNEV